MPAAGTTQFRQDYAFVDQASLIGRIYYRLKQMDATGSVEYFSIKFIDVSGRRKVTVYPTLIEESELRLRLNFNSEILANARILNTSGLEMESFSFTGSDFRKPLTLSAGAYMLKVNIESEQFLERFIVR